MLASEDQSKIEIVEEAATGVLTLAEGLDEDELSRSRLTRMEIKRLLLCATQALESLSAEAREAMSELDYAAWSTIGARIGAGGDAEHEARWFSIRALLPATLGWIRVYRQQSELFSSNTADVS